MAYPLFSFAATLFYCLVTIGLIQAGKWRWAVIGFACFIATALLISCIFSSPTEVIGTSGGIALPQKSKDFFVVSIGAELGVFVSVLFKLIKGACGISGGGVKNR